MDFVQDKDRHKYATDQSKNIICFKFRKKRHHKNERTENDTDVKKVIANLNPCGIKYKDINNVDDNDAAMLNSDIFFADDIHNGMGIFNKSKRVTENQFNFKYVYAIYFNEESLDECACGLQGWQRNGKYDNKLTLDYKSSQEDKILQVRKSDFRKGNNKESVRNEYKIQLYPFSDLRSVLENVNLYREYWFKLNLNSYQECQIGSQWHQNYQKWCDTQ